MIAFWSLIALVIVAASLTGNAILRNRVPIATPPGAAARLVAYLTKNVVETREDHRFPELRTRRYPVDADDLVEYVRRACEQLGWDAVGVDEASASVRAQIRTPLLGFTDDLEARVEAAGPGVAKLHLRSSSRVGRGDLGANARHVLDLQETLDALIASESAGG